MKNKREKRKLTPERKARHARLGIGELFMLSFAQAMEMEKGTDQDQGLGPARGVGDTTSSLTTTKKEYR